MVMIMIQVRLGEIEVRVWGTQLLSQFWWSDLVDKRSARAVFAAVHWRNPRVHPPHTRRGVASPRESARKRTYKDEGYAPFHKIRF